MSGGTGKAAFPVQILGTAAETGACIHVSLFGPLALERGDEATGGWQPVPRRAWGQGSPPRSVFKRLLTAPGRRLSRASLQEDLWPSASQDLADRYTNNALTVIRQVIGPELIETIGSLCQLAGQEVIWTDLDACRDLVRQAERLGTASQVALGLLEDAHRLLSRGVCLEDEAERWVYGVRADAARMQRHCCRVLADSYAARGLLYQAGERYQELLRLSPDEEVLSRWVRMLAEAGQRTEALSCYEETLTGWREQGMAESVSPALLSLVSDLRAGMHPPSRGNTPLVLSVGEIESREGCRDQDQEQARDPILLASELEVDVLAFLFRAPWTAGPLALYQRIVFETIGKYDMQQQHSHLTNEQEQERVIGRRHALAAIASFPLKLYGLASLSATPSHAPVLPPSESLSALAAGIAACWELRHDEPAGMRAIKQLLTIYLPTLTQLARAASTKEARAAAAHLTAQGYLLAHTLANYESRIDQMAATARAARAYGKLAADPNLEAAALVRLAVALDFEDKDRETLATYQEAASLPDFARVSPLLQARVYAGVAGMAAYCQQPREALVAFHQAQEVAPADVRSDPAFHFATCDTDALLLWQALALQYLDRPQDASAMFARAGGMEPVAGLLETNRAENLLYRSKLATQTGTLDEATAYLAAAHAIAVQIQHEHLQAETREAWRAMRLHFPREARILSLQERLF